MGRIKDLLNRQPVWFHPDGVIAPTASSDATPVGPAATTLEAWIVLDKDTWAVSSAGEGRRLRIRGRNGRSWRCTVEDSTG